MRYGKVYIYKRVVKMADDLYKVLDVPTTASFDEIKSSFLKK